MTEPIDIRDRPPISIDQVDINDAFSSDLAEILLTEGDIKSRVDRLATKITNDYQEMNIDEIYAMCVAKGAIRFFSDLLYNSRIFKIPFLVGVAFCSRYGMAQGTESTQRTQIILPTPKEIVDRHILVVEDIFDEGWTMLDLNKEIRKYNPASVSGVFLLDKPSRRQVEVLFDRLYIGFTIPDKFVVGYGLDFQEKYRALPHLCVLKPEIYEGKI